MTTMIPMYLSRIKASSDVTKKPTPSCKETLKLEEFIEKKDYTGAVTLLEFNNNSGNDVESELWIAYCMFHLGDFKTASKIYENLRRKELGSSNVSTNLACCYFYLGMYDESLNALNESPKDPLKARLHLHLNHKIGHENKLEEYEKILQDGIENQLSLASIHYLRSHYQEAIDIYKKILLENRDYLALNVYVALCYYKLDYYDFAQDVLQLYLQKYPDSAIAINLKACNHFRLYNGSEPQAEIKQLIEKISNVSFGHDLVRHNTVVFKDGIGALQVLPNLVDVIPEARLNLVIYYLKQDEIFEAHELIKDVEPAVPQEYILKGIVHAMKGQDTNSRENIKIAQQYFQLVGSSASECDTIPGRQCMASFFFLYRQFEDVLTYLKSIKTYFPNDDRFNFNYAQALTAAGYFKKAEGIFLIIRNEKYKNDYVYMSLLAHCYIMNNKAQLAWDLYLRMDTSAESFKLLQLIANVCYQIGEFWFSAQAFDVLERMDPTPEHWEGKRGACCGTFQYIVAEKYPKEILPEVIKLLKNTSNSQVEQIIRVIRKWARENRINC